MLPPGCHRGGDFDRIAANKGLLANDHYVLKPHLIENLKGGKMNRRFALLALSVTLVMGALHVRAEQSGNARQQGQANPTVDPDADRSNAGTTKFPLAAPAGKDSGAITTAPPEAVNQGPIDERTWKYGHRFDAP